MRIGYRGAEVKELQERLFSAGFDPGPLDGIFGPLTDKAVRAFQGEYNLAADGIAGSVTVEKLIEITVKPHKALNRQLSPYFNEMEFACKGDGMVFVEAELVDKLEQLRQLIGRAIIITSGYRSPWYNAKVGGAVQSRHMLGQAADIVAQGLKPAEVAASARAVGFGGIGIYDRSGFTHVDTGPSRQWRE